MNAKLSRHMTLLGLCSMAFYALMLATGKMSVEVMPQFVVSALIFLSSGKLMKGMARATDRSEDEKKAPPKKRPEVDWPWLTALLNWCAAFLIIGIMAIFLMKPVGVSIMDGFRTTLADESSFAGFVP